MGKSTISMAIFHCHVSSPEGRCNKNAVGRWMTFLMRLLKTRRPYECAACQSFYYLAWPCSLRCDWAFASALHPSSRIRCWLHAWTGLLTRQRTYCRIVWEIILDRMACSRCCVFWHPRPLRFCFIFQHQATHMSHTCPHVACVAGIWSRPKS